MAWVSAIPLKVGNFRIYNRSGYTEIDECSSRASYDLDTSKVSFVKILSIEKDLTTKRTKIRGRFKLYYLMQSQKDGENFPKEVLLDDGAFLASEVYKEK